MEKKYREVNESDIGKEIEGCDSDQTIGGYWYPVTLKHIVEPDKDGRSFLGLSRDRWVAFRHARAEITPSYLELHQASGLKVGDWVRITRAAKDGEQGWDGIWAPYMNQFVGSIAQISADLGGSYGFRIDGAGSWNYPCFVLEKVTYRPATKADEGLEVHWTAEPEKRYWLLSVFKPMNDNSAKRAVLEPLHGGPFQFAFLDSIFVPLAPAPEPPAEPDPAPAKDSELIHNGKTYSLAEDADIGKEVYVSDYNLAKALTNDMPTLIDIEHGTRSPYLTDSGRFNFAYVEVKMKDEPAPAPEPVVCDHQICELSQPTGVTCPPDSCDIDDKVRELPAPAPQRPAWLPEGFRVKAKDEVIRPGDAVQANPSTEDPSGRWLFGIAGALEGKKVYQSRYLSDVWITPISEGQANG